MPAIALTAFARLLTDKKFINGWRLLLEYSAYRLYNQLTPASHRVRLATIDYVGSDNRPLTTRIGFFLEDIDDVAARNGMRRAATGERIGSSQLSSADAARLAMFEYMISNLDWSMRAGPPGDRCCHNSRLLGRAGAAINLFPVPYDFDFSGLVSAPYAAPDRVRWEYQTPSPITVTGLTNGLSYTFKLRRGVKWHDGCPFTADDVLWNFGRITTATGNRCSAGGSLSCRPVCAPRPPSHAQPRPAPPATAGTGQTTRRPASSAPARRSPASSRRVTSGSRSVR